MVARLFFVSRYNVKASVQIRAANSLLSIVHSMKLQLLLSDEAQIVERRDAELATTLEEKEAAKAKVAELLSELLQQPFGGRTRA
jgi:mediator of RNA polymerase II transcription subunit 22